MAKICSPMSFQIITNRESIICLTLLVIAIISTIICYREKFKKRFRLRRQEGNGQWKNGGPQCDTNDTSSSLLQTQTYNSSQYTSSGGNTDGTTSGYSSNSSGGSSSVRPPSGKSAKSGDGNLEVPKMSRKLTDPSGVVIVEGAIETKCEYIIHYTCTCIWTPYNN